jgi:hypothetical protein
VKLEAAEAEKVDLFKQLQEAKAKPKRSATETSVTVSSMK